MPPRRLSLLARFAYTLKICPYWLTVIAPNAVGAMLMLCGPNSKNCHRRPKSWLKVAWLQPVRCQIVES